MWGSADGFGPAAAPLFGAPLRAGAATRSRAPAARAAAPPAGGEGFTLRFDTFRQQAHGGLAHFLAALVDDGDGKLGREREGPVAETSAGYILGHAPAVAAGCLHSPKGTEVAGGKHGIGRMDQDQDQ